MNQLSALSRATLLSTQIDLTGSALPTFTDACLARACAAYVKTVAYFCVETVYNSMAYCQAQVGMYITKQKPPFRQLFGHIHRPAIHIFIISTIDASLFLLPYIPFCAHCTTQTHTRLKRPLPHPTFLRPAHASPCARRAFFLAGAVTHSSSFSSKLFQLVFNNSLIIY